MLVRPPRRSNEVMTVVKSLARMGITVCATIHSPTPYSFNLFDRLLLLLRGQVVYFGTNGEGGGESSRAGRGGGSCCCCRAPPPLPACVRPGTPCAHTLTPLNHTHMRCRLPCCVLLSEAVPPD